MPKTRSDKEVLKNCVNAIGGNDVVAAYLWGDDPDKQLDKQAKYLDRCFLPGRSEKLCWTQVMRILKLANRKGYHKANAHFNAQMGYEAPAPINRESERAELQKQFVQAVDVVQAISDRLALMDGSSDV